MRRVWVAATVAVAVVSSAAVVVAQEDRSGRERGARGGSAGDAGRSFQQERRQVERPQIERPQVERRVERPPQIERRVDRPAPERRAAEPRQGIGERRGYQAERRDTQERREAVDRKAAERRRDSDDRKAAEVKRDLEDRKAVERKRDVEERKAERKRDIDGKAAERKGDPLKDGDDRKAAREDRELRERSEDRAERREERRDDRADRREERRKHVQLSDRQRIQIRDILTRRNVRLIRHADFAISIGVRVPRKVRLYPVPVDIIEFVPEYRGYSYFVADDYICIVDPGTYEIVYVVDRRQPAHELAVLELTGYERDFLIRHIEWERARSNVDLRLALGVDLPRRVELHRFPDVVLTEIPKLRRYRYVVVERDIIICDPDDREIALVINA